MAKEVHTNQITKALLLAGLAVLVGFVFLQQVRMRFMLEDLDYLRNMATGEELGSLKDVFQSMGWISKNLGGSLFSQFVLQLILLMGETPANILNTLVLMAVSVLICQGIQAKHQRLFFSCFAFFLLIAMNQDWIVCYFWQFGIVNYFYPALWMLLFLIYYSRFLDKPKRPSSVREGVLIGLCGLLAGWTNAGYGLVCLACAVFSILLSKYLLGMRLRLRMAAGGFGALLGIFLYLLPSGNYGNESLMRGIFVSVRIFPAVIMALAMMAILLRVGGYLVTSQIMQLLTLGFAVVLCFLISAVPFTSANGILLCTVIQAIMLFCGMMYRMNRFDKKHRIYGYILAGIMFFYDVAIFAAQYVGVS
ncbi:MAG: DUF6056 family protein [Lachnospiraceae bacterium]|nr:DUF6056 family protein [Lachnospiraceae bacterium]